MAVVLRDLDEGRQVTGSELLDLQFRYSMVLVAALITTTYDELQENEPLHAWIAKNRSSAIPQGALAGLVTPEHDFWADFTKSELKSEDPRIGVDLFARPSHWDTHNLLDVFIATLQAIIRVSALAAGRILEHS